MAPPSTAARSLAAAARCSWLTVRAADGALYEQLGGGSLLRLGPRLTTLARSGGPRPDILWQGFERDIRETVFVDEATRMVHWWQYHLDWLSQQSVCDALWPGWTLVHEDRGTRGLIERSGRPLAAIRLPLDDQRKQLAEALARLLDKACVPRVMLARAAARLLAERPDSAVGVESVATHPDTPAEAGLLTRLAPQLDALIVRVDGC